MVNFQTATDVTKAFLNFQSATDVTKASLNFQSATDVTKASLNQNHVSSKIYVFQTGINLAIDVTKAFFINMPVKIIGNRIFMSPGHHDGYRLYHIGSPNSQIWEKFKIYELEVKRV